MNNDLFLEDAMNYVTDGEVDAAFAMLVNPELTLEKACADSGGSKLVVMAIQGKLKEALPRHGKIAPGDRYVNPWAEPAVIDSNNKRQLAAFAIYRTIERPGGQPQLFERGSAVN